MTARTPFVIAIASLMLLLEACSACDPDETIRKLAGSGALDCGHVGIGQSPAATDQCVLDAFMAGQPFRARYDRTGAEGEMADVVAFRDGTLFDLVYDSAADTIEGRTCPGTLFMAGGRTRVICPAEAPFETFCE